ncbi:MAG: glycosyltransferase family 4 protein [Bacteroidales bacterium]|nr:glycosyltransferase family 4 protein [Bacteroidales bacterium]
MRILIIKNAPGEIKVRNMTYNIQEIGLAIALRKKGHNCDVMCVSDDGQYHEQQLSVEGQSLTIYSMKAFVLFKNGWLRCADDIISQYDIIQSCEYNQMYTWHLSKKYRHKMVCFHGPYYCDFNKNYNKMAKIFDLLFVNRYMKIGTYFITKSELATDYLKRKGIKNIKTIGVGLSPTLLKNNEEVLPILKQIEKMKSIKLLYIGAIEPRRNTLFLLDILKKLIEDGEDVKLLLIGKYSNEDYQKLLTKHITSLNLKEHIFYIPRVEQKYLGYVYNNSDIFLLPTIYDIYGMVLLEAMYFGIPTLTTINGGSNMLINDGLNGFVFKDFDVNKWIYVIKNLIHDKQKSSSIRIEASKTIRKHFTWDVLADKFIEAYKDKLNNKK